MTIVVIMYPVPSHFYASFKFSKIIMENGIKVIYACEEFFKQTVEENGFYYYALNQTRFCIGLDRLQNIIEGSNTPYLDDLIDRITDRLYLHRKQAIDNLIIDLNPSIIFLDSFSSNDYLCLHSYVKNIALKVIFIQSMLSMDTRPGIPPPNSNILPENNIVTNIKIYFEKLYFFQRFNALVQFIKYFGYSDDRLIKKYAKLSKIKAYHDLDFNKYFSLGFKNVSELILAPEELEYFTIEPNISKFYLGLMIDFNRTASKIFVEDSNTVIKIEELFECSSNRIVYCSFGSFASFNKAYVGLVEGFLVKLINSFIAFKEYDLIISVSKEISSKLNIESKNIHFFEYVPQLEVLSHCSLFITHGGLNSIKEAIHYEVPLLVYPLEKRFDQPGNAARIYYHKLGLRGDMRKDTPQAIQSKIEELLTNPIYKQNMARLNQVCKEKYTDERIVEIFRNL